MKLISWNVNGLRAILKKGFDNLLSLENPDILCLQEVRATPAEVPRDWTPYSSAWNPAEKKGYSGVLTLSKAFPLAVSRGMGKPEHDREGRILASEYSDFILVNAYIPNSGRELARLPYRRRWDRDFLAYLRKLERRKPVVACGDFNVAHTELDLARPKENVGNHGFTPEERAGFQRFVDAGFADTFRLFEPGGGHYTWWSQMNRARERNIGWRIDYFLVSAALRPTVRSARILAEVPGSDHCPVALELSF